MSTFNLRKASPTMYEGDFVGSLGDTMRNVQATNKREVEMYKDFRIYEYLPVGSSVPRYAAMDNRGNMTESAGTPTSVKKMIDSQVPGGHPFVVQTPAHRGGGGTQGAAEAARAPAIRAATVAAARGRAGWHQIDTYKGFQIQKLTTATERPKYRAVWGHETTKIRDAITQTYQDVDQQANRPRVDFTRIMPGGKGLPDAVRARNKGEPATWLQRLEKARKSWGKTGLVEVFQGVEIRRGKRNLTGPDGKKVTVPVFYTKQKLMDVEETKEPVLQGYALLAGIGADSTQNLTSGQAEAPTLTELKAIVATKPLAPGEKPSPDEGPGPAAGTEPVETLPGEAGTTAQVTFWSDPRTKGAFFVSAWLVGLAVLLKARGNKGKK